MHGFDYSIPHFITHVQGTHIVVTPDLIFEVLHIRRVEFTDYPGYDCLRTMFKDELSSLFCETLSSCGDRQNAPCSGIIEGPRFLNMVMTFVLFPLSHYNSITELCARFLLTLLEGLTIDFPSYFILSFVDVYKDTTTCDELIFPLAITQILCHVPVSYLKSPHFSIMCAIEVVTVRWSKAQLRPKRPQTQTATPPASYAPSTSAPSSSVGRVTLEAIMAQLVRMDAHLDTLNNELCQVNTRVDRIARRQAVMGGFTASSSPSPQALEDASDDDGSGGGDADEDEASSSSGYKR